MDSGNSGSLQSSSGGDEEYDSRTATSTDSISAFLNHHHHHHHQSTLPNPSHPPFHSSIFDPLSNYNYDPRPQPFHTPNPLLNLDPLIWSNKTLQQQSQPDQINPFFSTQPDSQPRNTTLATSAVPLPPSATSDQNPRPASSPSTTPSSHAVRNPKKRSRASRRAPTTVLTTDTSNFRAMVQEFTGIPAPPFAASQFPRSRLDLFGTHSSIRSSNNPNNSTFSSTTPPPPPYLLRPFPQKLQPPPNAAFQSDFLNQTLPSSSFLAGLKTHNSLSESPGPSSNTNNNNNNNSNLVDDDDDEHQFGLGIQGEARGTPSTMVASGGAEDRGGANYHSHLNVKTTMGYSTNTGSYQVGRGLELETMNRSSGTRGEGMVESWICSTSD